MDKVAIGGAYKDYLKQLQSQLVLTNKEVVNYIQNAKKSAQQLGQKMGSALKQWLK